MPETRAAEELISEISLHSASDGKQILHLSSNQDAGAGLYSLILDIRSTLENLVGRWRHVEDVDHGVVAVNFMAEVFGSLYDCAAKPSWRAHRPFSPITVFHQQTCRGSLSEKA
jgi:hypothetical protein